jgi:hypothetical protein
MSDRPKGRELLDPTTDTDAESMNELLGDDVLPERLLRIIRRDTTGEDAKKMVVK